MPAPAAPGAAGAIILTADDSEKRRQLVIMRRRATGLLVVFAALFIVTRLLEPRFPWLGALRALSEAAMVGGLADWFAVTALFRHPMGIPIPHTAIVKARKDRIGRSLGNFVQNNFLAREVIARQLGGMKIAERVTKWASTPEHAQQIARQLAVGLARAVEVLPDEEVRETLHQGLVSRGRKTQVAPILSNVLALVAEDGRHQVLLDRVIVLVDRLVEENKEIIRERIAHESPWWVPTAVDEKLYQKIVAGIERMLGEVRADPAHPLRAQFDRVLAEFITNLESSPKVIARAEELKEQLLTSPVVGELSDSLWESAKRALLKYAGPDAPSPEPLERGITSLANTLASNPTVLAQIDEAISSVALDLIDHHRHEVGALIARTVSSWDPDAASEKIEIQVGRDLQFIRINGTLVGGLVGLLLYLLGLGVDRL